MCLDAAASFIDGPLYAIAKGVMVDDVATSPASMEQNDDLEAVLRADDATAQTFLRLLPHAADVVDSLRVLEVKEWPRILRLVPSDLMRAGAVALLEESERAALLSRLQPDEIGKLVRNLETDDAVDVIEELGPQEQRAALLSLPPETRTDVEDLLHYAHDTAGGLMQVERAQVTKDATVTDAIAKVRGLVARNIAVHAIFVVDAEGRLLGRVELQKLLLHPEGAKISELMEPVVAKVTPDVDQEVVAAIFKKYSVASLPVVDREGRLVGRILHDDIVHVLVEEAEEDALKQAGTSAAELLYRDRVFPIVRVRLPWLLTTLFCSLVSATVLFFYLRVLEHALILAAFVPVVSALSGTVGTQSATIIARSLATGRTNVAELRVLIFREVRIGLILGLVCGAVSGAAGYFLFSDGDAVLGLVVFVAIVLALMVSTTFGAAAPTLMKRLGVDPAIASGPFVTTANDVAAILVYMTTAFVVVEYLR